MNADPYKQQIPPLRCAPVGMTDYVSNFRDRILESDPEHSEYAGVMDDRTLYFLTM
jgi:hypothetical protein